MVSLNRCFASFAERLYVPFANERVCFSIETEQAKKLVYAKFSQCGTGLKIIGAEWPVKQRQKMKHRFGLFGPPAPTQTTIGQPPLPFPSNVVRISESTKMKILIPSYQLHFFVCSLAALQHLYSFFSPLASLHRKNPGSLGYRDSLMNLLIHSLDFVSAPIARQSFVATVLAVNTRRVFEFGFQTIQNILKVSSRVASSHYL